MRHLLIACVSGAVVGLVGTVLGSDPEGAATEGGELSDVADQCDGLDVSDWSGETPPA